MFGLPVGVYAAIEKAGSIIFRCNLSGFDVDRRLEILALDVRPIRLRAALPLTGIGAKDVAVSFKSLQWKMDRPRTAADGAPTSTTDPGTPMQPSGARSTKAQGYLDHAVLNMTQIS